MGKVFSSSQELKKALLAEGLEIYRTRPDAVHLAERPRDNQILDAGIAIFFRGAELDWVKATSAQPTLFTLQVVMRAQKSDFPNDDVDTLYRRVRLHAESKLPSESYLERECREQKITDPGHSERILDVWYEIVFARRFEKFSDVVAEIKRVLRLEKYAKHQ